MTLSRTLRNILLVKTPVRPVMGDVEPVGKKNRENKWFLPCNFSSKEGLPTETGDTFKEVEFADSDLKVFSLDGLKIATKNFSENMVLGEGAFGKVFIGWLEHDKYVPSKPGSGIPVAVKELDIDGYQGFEEWQTETSNILLDQDFNAKIADLGLAKHGPINGETHLITRVMGTYGYVAPEYVATGDTI
ncbi:hypothetical protein L1987_45645 [Smallanthus sonchifolius]|uniref:Uncharacterized protein n=1 Tax=Smallanthus sonchifolius TaxID=185202 RepID=A0ACB9FY59_9ASTR|nr:hypothetical protein L1987_45645 [Smallanthus sonchifolius]